MICVKFTAFCDLRADLRICLATLRKSVRKFWFCKLALTCVNLRVRLARGLRKQARPQINQHSNICLTFLWRSARSLAISFWLLSSLDGVENRTMLFRHRLSSWTDAERLCNDSCCHTLRMQEIWCPLVRDKLFCQWDKYEFVFTVVRVFWTSKHKDIMIIPLTFFWTSNMPVTRLSFSSFQLA